MTQEELRKAAREFADLLIKYRATQQEAVKITLEAEDFILFQATERLQQ